MALTLERFERLAIGILLISLALALGHYAAPYMPALLFLTYGLGMVIVLAAIIVFALFWRR